MTGEANTDGGGARLKAAVFAAILVGGFLLINHTPAGEWTSEARIREALISIRTIWWTPIALLVLYAIAAPTGISMFPLTIAGAAFGPVAGSILNTIGIVIGAATAFLVARSLGRDFVVRITGKRIRKAERLLNRQGFWPLVQVRFLPLPYPLINFAAALSGVPVKRFMLASVVGLVPATMIHSYFIARLIYTNGQERLEVGLQYAAVLVVINGMIGFAWWRTQRQRRARYLSIIEERAGEARR